MSAESRQPPLYVVVLFPGTNPTKDDVSSTLYELGTDVGPKDKKTH